MLIPFCICLFALFLVVFSNNTLYAAKKGLTLWANSIVPTLFPFLIATELLGYTNLVSIIANMVNGIMKPIFNVSGIGAFPLIMGTISGYPIGAKIVSNLKTQQKISSVEAERLIAYTNNSSPLFILGTIGIGLFGNKQVGILLLITHILAGISVGFIFRYWKREPLSKNREKGVRPLFPYQISITNLGEVLSNSIMSAINTILIIGGFIVLFSVIISIFESSGILRFISNFFIPVLNIFKIPSCFANGFFSGIIELTNGISIVALVPNKAISQNIILCAFMLGFGSFCVLFQIMSIISKAHISIKPYIIGKLLQGTLAAVYTYLIIQFIPIFNLNL